MKFRKKPVVIEAHQWLGNGDHPEDYVGQEEAAAKNNWEGRIVRYFRRPDVDGKSVCSECCRTFHDHGWIETKEGGHRVCPGDWIITGVQGERYPCKANIFQMTYEPALSAPAEPVGEMPEPVMWCHKDAAVLKQGKTHHPSVDADFIPLYAATPDADSLRAEIAMLRAGRDAVLEEAAIHINSLRDLHDGPLGTIEGQIARAVLSLRSSAKEE